MTRQDCRNIIEGRLTPKRLYHSECVADAAVMLAEQYGADPHRAMLAGMLHDCMKCAPIEEQRVVCERLHPLRAEDLEAPQMWHAFAGAAYLELECGVTDEAVLGAVRWHTTGHAGMTLLEEIVFTADKISADRTYPDAEVVRAFGRQSLHAASQYILEHIFSKLEQSGRRAVHPDSADWYNELTEGESVNGT